MNASPFISYEFLGALEKTGCIGKKGVKFLFISHFGKKKVEGMLLYFLKGHSYGEYIFDWAWADAFQRAGLPYYPKFCSQTPFTPISDPKAFNSS